MARILVIDDDPGMRRVIRRLLSNAGHSVTEAEDGVVGLSMAKTAELDLVITDLLMPDIDGVELIRRMRSERPEIPVMAISGGGRLSAVGHLISAYKAGAITTLEKPFQGHLLIAAVDTELDRAAPET